MTRVLAPAPGPGTGEIPADRARQRLTVVPLLRAVRPRQWLKNVLVVGAPLASGHWLRAGIIVPTLLAFVTFCMAASAVYLVNDVVDVAEDRAHPVKRRRPIAAGELSVRAALASAVVLGGGALGLAFAVRPQFAGLVAAYLAAAMSYATWLRREPVLELVLVATGFLLRGAAGGVAAGIAVSSWFMLVAGFGSLFLVAGKRYSELMADRPRSGRRVSLSAYTPTYLRFVWGMAATITLTAYALWADQVFRVREDGAWALWSLLPFLLAILKYALDVDRGAAEGPEDVVLADRVLQAFAVAWLVMMAIGTGSVDGIV